MPSTVVVRPRRWIARFLLVGAIAGASAASRAQTSWEAYRSMIGRSGPAVATDSARARVVMFGGVAWNELDDHWEWDGSTWSRVSTPLRPPARHGAGMAFDSNRQRMVLFGGHGGPTGGLDDTWEYDGVNWTQITTPVRPSARMRPGMAFDAARGVVLLFGGDTIASSISNETWTWDGVSWTQLVAVAPPGRSGAPLSYDSGRSRTVMFGGWGGSNNLADTWEWDGVAWTQRSPLTSPPPRAVHTLSYDPVRNRTVLVGGSVNYPSPVSSGAVWEWDGITWTPQATPPSAITRESAGGAFDPIENRTLIVQGGVAPSVVVFTRRTDTWDWNGSVWRLRHDASHPPAQQGCSWAWHPSSQAAVLFFGTYSSSSIGTWHWDGVNWSLRQPTSSPSPRGGPMATDRLNDRVVLFGGISYAPTSIHGDTWLWTGSNWLQQATPVAPAPRWGHLMTWDSVRNRVVLYGGDGATVYNDMWEWSGTAWTQRFPATLPPWRYGAAWAFDEAHGQAVLFGGLVGSSYLADTWLWDGTNWSQAQPAVSPTARSGAAMTYDAFRQRVVLHGGQTGPPSQRLSDTWEWDGTSWTQRIQAAGPQFDNGGQMLFNPVTARCELFDGESVANYSAISPASATAYGSACVAPGSSPVLQARALPWLGDLSVIEATNLPTGTQFVPLVIGVSDVTFSGQPLPAPISGTGSPGCLLWASAEVLTSMSLQGSSATATLAIPMLPAALGFEFFEQAASYEPTLNPAGIVTTNPLRLVVGSR